MATTRRGTFIWQGHIQEHVANTHLPQGPTKVQRHSNEQLECDGLEGGRVGGNLAIKVLLVTADNNLSFILLRLNFVHPLAGEDKKHQQALLKANPK